MTPRAKVFAALLLATSAALIAVFGLFYFRDNFFTHYPIKVISQPVYRALGIPWWNFYDGGGQPLAGNPNTLTFYPDNILYLFLPAHVAFNLHFLVHLIAAWFAMRALCGATGASESAARVAATMYAMSGLVISSLVFYNLVTSIALIPFALWAIESASSPLILGAAFGLIALAGEPVMVISTGICALVVGYRRIGRIAIAVAIAAIVAAPQLIAYAEIAGEVERAYRFSANATLAASLWPLRIAEIVVGPILGFLTDPGHAEFRERLFSTVFLGLIVVPAVATARRVRYVVIGAVMLFFALGKFNPLVNVFIDAIPRLRVARYPEKFSVALTVALVVLVAAFVDRLTRKWRIAWGVVTFVPLAAFAIHGAPIDWFAPYRVPQYPRPIRICYRSGTVGPFGHRPAREEYRDAARVIPPIFGAVGGIRYATDRSPEGMLSLMTRFVAERIDATPPVVGGRYLSICGCFDAPDPLPMVWFVPRVVPIRSVNEEVQTIESGRFDEHAAALAPAPYAALVSPPQARVTSYAEGLQDITIGVTTPSQGLLFVNQSFFRAWMPRIGRHELATLPLDIDRLGVIVPAGEHTISLRFGRHRTATAIAWLASIATLIVAAVVAVRR